MQYEPTVWMRDKVQERLVMADPFLANVDPRDKVMILIPLTSPPENADEESKERWERSCDRCDTYVPPEVEDFFTGMIKLIPDQQPAPDIQITFGLCSGCHALEHIGHD